MRIAAASLDFAATHASASKFEVEERLQAWVGPRPREAAEPVPARSVVLSDAGRQALTLEQADSSAASAPVADDEMAADPRMELLKSIVEMMTGRSIRVMSAAELAVDASSQLAAPDAAAPEAAARQPDFGIEYDRRETRESSEETHFEARGTIRTADGRMIDFSVGLAMQRSETVTSSVSLRAGNAVSKDPLVINFGGSAASLRNQRFSLDLLGDGNKVDVPVLGQGSGFLVLDALGAGKVESGRQLFGPASGDGFADLAQYDSDASGWIDEADPVFGRLGVWTPDAHGGGAVVGLDAAGVGALYLGRTATPFTLKDGGEELGAIRTSGVFVGEDGRVGTLQQVDLKV